MSPLAGRLTYFVQSWEKLTSDQNVLSLVKGYEIPILVEPFQEKSLHQIKMSSAEKQLVDSEIEEMLKKGAILKVDPVNGQFLSNLFLVDKKDGRHRPVINLKKLNKFIPYRHFKMEGLHSLKQVLREGDFMCKLDLKDAYFCVPLQKNSI